MDSLDQAKLTRGQSIVRVLRGRFIFQIEITERELQKRNLS
jgi:hypothetical protein